MAASAAQRTKNLKLLIEGTYYRFPPMRFHPQPVQRPRPPILLGGTAPRVFQRAAIRTRPMSRCLRVVLIHDTVQQYQAAGANRLVFTMGSTPAANPFERLELLAKAAGL